MGDRDINDRWADFLRARMHRMGIAGPSDLARKSGVDQSVISRWLNEGRTPTIDALRALREPLDLPLRNLLIEAGHVTEEDLPVVDATKPGPAPESDPASVGVDTEGPEEMVFRLRVPPEATPRQRELARRAAMASVRAILEDLDEE